MDHLFFRKVHITCTILDDFTFNCTTSIVFAINQLSPSSINISPLIIIHWTLLLQWPIRSIYLMMTGSLGFGSINFNLSLSLSFTLLKFNNLLTHYAIGKRKIYWIILLLCTICFMFYFTRSTFLLFNFPSRYFYSITYLIFLSEFSFWIFIDF